MSETIITLSSKKYKSEGDLSWEYNPLHNIIKDKGEDTVPHALSDFDTDDFNLDMEHPVEVEVQPSYDGSVNLIINDDHDVPRIVNSAFTVQEGWKYKRVVRDQQVQTNYYHVDKVDETTRLFRTTSTFLHVDLFDITSGGELKGGNYKFYFKYGDEDFNETDWVGESGIVSIFHGFPSHIKDVRGTLMHEKTDHQITLDLSGVDVAFSKLYVYVKRSYSDLNGVLMDEYYKIVDPYDIVSTSFAITINGFEKTTSVSQDVFNIAYNVYDAVATSAQVQNRLFFGNVKETVPNHNILSNCALNIVVGITQENVGNVGTEYMPTGLEGAEYYNALNIYNKLGYWPGELYRFGVVFIYNNDTLSDAYNLKGCCFDSINSYNHGETESENTIKTYDINDIFINGDSKYNTRGVFQMPDENIYSNEGVKPLGLKIRVPECVRTKLRELNIKGMFFVRQPRIPIVLAQALSIGVSDRANIPVLSKQENEKSVYMAETILKDNTLTRETRYSIDEYGDEAWSATCCALLCQDVNLNKSLQSLFDGTQFILKPIGKYNLTTTDLDARLYSATKIEHVSTTNTSSVKLAYIAPETASRVLEGRVFSSKAGSESELVTLKNLRWDSEKTWNDKRPVDEYTVRGNYTGYLGVVSGELEPNVIYNIYSSSYIGTTIDKRRLQIEARAQDSTPFTSVSQRVSLDDLRNNSAQYIFGGDCFSCTTSIKMCSNFLDYNTPLNDKIVKYDIKTESDEDNDDWNDYNSWEVNDRNLSDWNAVSIGHYVTYKCLSNFNLGLRCLDDQRTDERALFGDIRNFYPYSQHTYGVSFKIPESNLMNAGNSSTGGAIYHFAPNKVPFTKEFFDNRIAFSNIQSVDSFQNNYRVFSNLSYTDVERKYGAIVKLLPLGANLFCVFEHGCGIVPINEKALLSTTTGQSIHLYGSDVVQSQITVISPDYGSTWEESIIVTPNGIYGVDTFAKKIWRYSSEGFAVISDMLVQRFLNDNINLTDYEQNAIVASRNVKTHYNNYKGDVMFTFYNGDKEWNLCYNERIQKWVTKYSWTPAYSANIYNSFISTDKHSTNYAEVSNKLGPLVLEEGSPELNVYENNAKYNSSFRYYLKGYDSFEQRGKNGDIRTDYTAQLEINSLTLHVGNKKTVLDWSKVESSAKIYEDYLPEEKTCTWTIPPHEHGKLVKWECPKGFIVGVRNTNDLVVDSTDASWITSEIFEGSTEVIADQLFTDWIYYTWNDSKILIKLSLSGDALSKETLIHRVDLDISYQIIQNVKEYEDSKDENPPKINSLSVEDGRSAQPLLLSSNNLSENLKKDLEDLRCVRFYTHGRAGYHESRTQQHLLKPTYWYGKQEPFEFEFVINSNTGVQKIFDNLMIVSNNAEPDSIECTIIGDSYGFDKEKILSGSEDKLDFNVEFKVNPNENIVFKTNISKDHVLNQYTLTSCAKLRDLADIKYGRRLGNMHYLEDKWSITLDPIYYKTWSDDKTTSKTNSVKLRDKWMKVRIKYKGDKLAVISAIQSLYTVSFA